MRQAPNDFRRRPLSAGFLKDVSRPPFRRDPLIPHLVTAGDDILPDCGHSVAVLCDGCGSCEGCYCGEAEDEPAHLLAAS